MTAPWILVDDRLPIERNWSNPIVVACTSGETCFALCFVGADGSFFFSRDKASDERLSVLAWQEAPLFAVGQADDFLIEVHANSRLPIQEKGSSSFILREEGRVLRRPQSPGGAALDIGMYRAAFFFADDAAKQGLCLRSRLLADKQLKPYAALYQTDLPLFAKSVSSLVPPGSLNLLVIELLTIRPRFQGNNFGLQAISRLSAKYSHQTPLAALCPYPLADSEDRGRLAVFGCFDTSGKEAMTKLIGYYEHAGFVAIPKTKVMVMRQGAQ